jgi:hypothetical protein
VAQPDGVMVMRRFVDVGECAAIDADGRHDPVHVCGDGVQGQVDGFAGGRAGRRQVHPQWCLEGGPPRALRHETREMVDGSGEGFAHTPVPEFGVPG